MVCVKPGTRRVEKHVARRGADVHRHPTVAGGGNATGSSDAAGETGAGGFVPAAGLLPTLVMGLAAALLVSRRRKDEA